MKMQRCRKLINHCCNDTSKTNFSSFNKAIEYAYYKENGKKHSHQWRIPNYALNSFIELIKNKKEVFITLKTFDEIIKEVEFEKIPLIGELAIYDMALAIGVYINVLPDKVYLHRGTRVGAENLLKMKFGKIKSIEIKELPKWLQKTEPYIIEDFLCIYKENPTEINFKKYIQESVI